MSLELRPYQVDLVARLRAALSAHRAVCLQLPTGGGKTAIAAAMAAGVVARGKRFYFFVHRQELIEQAERTFKLAALPYGVIAAGWQPAPFEPVQIVSVDTMRFRLGSGFAVPVPAVAIWDECHHLVAPSWLRVFSHFRDALTVGLTATPARLDGVGLGDLFGALLPGPSIAELIAGGWLVRPRCFSPYAPDLDRVGTRAGDYIPGQAAEVMDRPTVTGDAVDHYLRLGGQRPALAFCVNVEHSKHVVERFQAAGVNAAHLDGGVDRATRKYVVEQFRRGEIDLLSSVDLFGEGFDVPGAKVAILLRPTRSLTLFLQQCGRVARPDGSGESSIILDHAGNIRRHGLPDIDREWALDGKEKRTQRRKPGAGAAGALALVTCPKCACSHVPQPRCPECGHAYPPPGPRQVEGELVELDDPHREALAAPSLDALIALGRERGYRDPAAWAQGFWLARVRVDDGRGAASSE